jgi:uncharacterized membrane protein
MKLSAHSRRWRKHSLILACGLVCGTAALAQSRYAVAELPVLPGTVQCTATGVNDLSEVIGHCGPAVEDWNQTAVVWRQGQVYSLGKWPNGTYSQGTVINNFGGLAGHADEGNLRPQGWVTRSNGQWVNFFPNSSGNTYPLFVGDNGWVGGYFIKGSRGVWTAAIWRPEAKDPTRYRLEAFPHLPGATNARSIQSLANGFNRAGVGVGQSAHDNGARAVLWRNDAKHTLEVLPFPADGEATMANAINDLGQVIGDGGRNGQFGYQPVLWANDSRRTASYLPLLPGYNSARGLAINNLGQVIGVAVNYTDVATTAAAEPSVPVVWRDGGVFKLQALIDPAVGATLNLQEAADLNERGQIAITALRNGLKRALLLTPQN